MELFVKEFEMKRWEKMNLGRSSVAESEMIDKLNQFFRIKVQQIGGTSDGGMDGYDSARKIRVEVKYKKNDLKFGYDKKFLEDIQHHPGERVYIYMNPAVERQSYSWDHCIFIFKDCSMCLMESFKYIVNSVQSPNKYRKNNSGLNTGFNATSISVSTFDPDKESPYETIRRYSDEIIKLSKIIELPVVELTTEKESIDDATDINNIPSEKESIDDATDINNTELTTVENVSEQNEIINDNEVDPRVVDLVTKWINGFTPEKYQENKIPISKPEALMHIPRINQYIKDHIPDLYYNGVTTTKMNTDLKLLNSPNCKNGNVGTVIDLYTKPVLGGFLMTQGKRDEITGKRLVKFSPPCKVELDKYMLKKPSIDNKLLSDERWIIPDAGTNFDKVNIEPINYELNHDGYSNLDANPISSLIAVRIMESYIRNLHKEHVKIFTPDGSASIAVKEVSPQIKVNVYQLYLHTFTDEYKNINRYITKLIESLDLSILPYIRDYEFENDFEVLIGNACDEQTKFQNVKFCIAKAKTGDTKSRKWNELNLYDNLSSISRTSTKPSVEFFRNHINELTNVLVNYKDEIKTYELEINCKENTTKKSGIRIQNHSCIQFIKGWN